MKTQVDLYKLPKDILVKLYLSLQDELSREYETHMKRIIYDVNEVAERTRMVKCYKKGCKKYIIKGKWNTKYAEELVTCELHDGSYCSCIEHLDESGLRNYKSVTACQKCIEENYKKQISLLIGLIYEYVSVKLGDGSKAGYVEKMIGRGKLKDMIPEIIGDLEKLLDEHHQELDEHHDNRTFLEEIVKSYKKYNISKKFLISFCKSIQNVPGFLNVLHEFPGINGVITDLIAMSLDE